MPLPIQKAKYYRELEAAVDVVERACHLCVDVIFLPHFLFLHCLFGCEKVRKNKIASRETSLVFLLAFLSHAC